jgi:NHS family xanthosine MFS transporter
MIEFVTGQGNTIGLMVVQQSILMKDWHTIWLAFAIYALVIAVAFAVLFKAQTQSYRC